MQRFLKAFPIGLIFLGGFGCNLTGKYKIERTNLNGLTRTSSIFESSVGSGTKFVEIFVNTYRQTIKTEIALEFQSNFQLCKKKSVSAKLVLSTFGEALVYLFPAEANDLFVDGINFSVQTALLYGLIDLNVPEAPTNLQRVSLKVPLSEAIKQYKEEPAKITFSGAGTNGWFMSDGGLHFSDVTKMFSFPKQSMVGVVEALWIDNSTSLYQKIQGKQGELRFNLAGPLFIVGENDFSWAYNVAQKVARDFAELEIKKLILSSEFFKFSLAEQKLQPQAETILQKKSRSEKDISFRYPLWEFKKDIAELKKEAEKLRIDASYVDELLEHNSAKIIDGTLLWYYNDPTGFMWQCTLVNIVLLSLVILLFGVKRHRKGTSRYIVKPILNNLPTFQKKAFLLTVLPGVNIWIVQNRPSSAGLAYWLLPGSIFLLAFLRVAFVQPRSVETKE
jgi:hypothetical protein